MQGPPSSAQKGSMPTCMGISRTLHTRGVARTFTSATCSSWSRVGVEGAAEYWYVNLEENSPGVYSGNIF